MLQFADKVCVLYDGELVDYGSVEQIKSGGNHNYTKTLLDAIPEINTNENSNIIDIKCKKILSLKNINVQYPLGSWISPDILDAVNNVSIDLYHSHITSLIGESGSGKSTIAKAISGLEKLDSGYIIQHNDQERKEECSCKKT